LTADGDALKTAHQKMEADIASGADKAVLGGDVLALDAARSKMKSDTQAIHDQVLAQLSTEQQTAFNACATAHKPHHTAGTSPQAPPQ
jgi:predicted house-cleaning NTP pyrophosphatase (Maf/HAM1 superfamily)